MDIFKNEATASARIGGPTPFFDANGDFKSGLTFDHTVAVVPGGAVHGSWEVETFSIDGGWVQAAADAIEDGNSGHYRQPYSQPETDHDSYIMYRLSKPTYATVYYTNAIKSASALAAGAITEATIAETVWRKLGRILDTTATLDNAGPGGTGRVTFLDATVAVGDTDYWNGLVVRPYAGTGGGPPVFLTSSPAIDNTNMIVAWSSGLTYICRKPWPPGALSDGVDPANWRVLLERFSGLNERQAIEAIDTKLSTVHGGGAWDADGFLAALKTLVVDPNGANPATWFGLQKRLNAAVAGELVITVEGDNLRFTWKDAGGNVMFTGLVDVAARARAASLIAGSE